MSDKFKVLGYDEFGSGFATPHAPQAQDDHRPLMPIAKQPDPMLPKLLDDFKVRTGA